MECQPFAANMETCNCSYEPCSRKGYCCQCIAYHRRIGELPACYFTADEERTYDRSITFFAQQRRG